MKSAKFQIFALSQLLTLGALFAAKYNVDPKVFETLAEIALGKLGVEASVLKAAHAYVDAHVTASRQSASVDGARMEQFTSALDSMMSTAQPAATQPPGEPGHESAPGH